MIPDFKHLSAKVSGWLLSHEVRHLLGGLGVVVLLLCYAMMGLWGTITFMFGIFTVLAFQVILLFIYISYERKRAQNFSEEREQDQQAQELLQFIQDLNAKTEAQANRPPPPLFEESPSTKPRRPRAGSNNNTDILLAP